MTFPSKCEIYDFLRHNQYKIIAHFQQSTSYGPTQEFAIHQIWYSLFYYFWITFKVDLI